MGKEYDNKRLRRDFIRFNFSAFTGKKSNLSMPDKRLLTKDQKIKMLTADGELVEVDQSVFEKARKGKKARNMDIFKWMKNKK